MVQDPSLLVGFRVCSRLQVVYALVCFENIRCRVVELEDILGFTDWKEKWWWGQLGSTDKPNKP